MVISPSYLHISIELPNLRDRILVQIFFTVQELFCSLLHSGSKFVIFLTSPQETSPIFSKSFSKFNCLTHALSLFFSPFSSFFSFSNSIFFCSLHLFLYFFFSVFFLTYFFKKWIPLLFQIFSFLHETVFENFSREVQELLVSGFSRRCFQYVQFLTEGHCWHSRPENLESTKVTFAFHVSTYVCMYVCVDLTTLTGQHGIRQHGTL